jgi:DNA (cytosine-5)-methyltransferase 1
MAVETLGYSVSPHIVDAADHGVPQTRRRLFLVCTRSRSPLVLFLASRPVVPASGIIDESALGWGLVERAGRSPRTLERVENGRAAHGERFLVAYYGSERGGRSLARPLGTVTTHDRYALVDGPRMRMLAVSEYRAAMGFPADYQLPANHRLAVHMLGNAVCPPVARDIILAIKAAA